MLELKAELYEREQQAAKRAREPRTVANAARPIVTKSAADSKNRGVEQRAARDLAQSQADASSSIASLTRKAALYNSMQSSTNHRDDDNNLVDWELKQWDRQPVQSEYHWSETQLQSADTRREQERRRWEEQQARDDDDERARDQRLATLNSVIEQNDRERTAHSDARAERKRLQDQRAALIRQKADERKRAVAAVSDVNDASVAVAVPSPPSSPPPPPPPPPPPNDSNVP